MPIKLTRSINLSIKRQMEVPKIHSKMSDCEHCLSQSHGFLTCASSEILQKVGEHKIGKTFPKGSHIFLGGEDVQGIYCVSSGLVKIYYSGENGKDHLLRVAGPGDILGYRALLSDEPYKASAMAAEKVEACFIPKDVFSAAIKNCPELALSLLGKISKEFGGAESRFSSVTDKEAVRRVAESLLFLKASFPDHPWTRKDIGEWASTTPETVMRVLSKFVDQGYIRSESRKIEILNENALKKIAAIDEI